MVSICDNWQTKAEKAAKRRELSKKKKQQRDTTRRNKAMAQAFVAYLQEHGHLILLAASTGANKKNSELVFHVWVDTAPSNHRCHSVLTTMENGDIDSSHCSDCGKPEMPEGSKKGRPRSQSCTEQFPSSSKQKKGRNRSNSDFGTLGDTQGSEGIEDVDQPSMCLDHFFGKCTGSVISPKKSRNRRKSTGFGHQIEKCANGLHSSEKLHNETIASVLLEPKHCISQFEDRGEVNVEALSESLTKAKEVMNADLSADYPTVGIQMLYHIEARMNTDDIIGNAPPDPGLLAEALLKELNKGGINIGSIVYCVINDMLVFDRHRGGLIVTDADDELLRFGGSKRRSVSIGDDKERYRSDINDSSSSLHGPKRECEPTVLEHHRRTVQYLPGAVLEYLIGFLPIEAAGVFPQVCSAWKMEMDRASAGLWCQLMDRHGWPYDFISSTGDTIEAARAYRGIFLRHYKAVKDVDSIIHGLETLTLKSGNTTRRDAVTFDFRQDATGRPILGKTFVQQWSDSRLIVGSSDCSLHFYDVIDDSAGTGKRLKQSLRVMTAPFADAGRRKCKMTGFDLDEDFVLCTYNVGGDPWYRTWISHIKRDDLLSSKGRGSHVSTLRGESIRSYDMTKMVFDYINQSSDETIVSWIDHQLADGLDKIDEVDVVIKISKSPVPAGNGNFLFSAEIIFVEDNDLFFSMAVEEDRLSKIFLFSCETGSISWVSSTTFTVLPSTICRLPQGGGRGLAEKDHDVQPCAAFLCGDLRSQKIRIVRAQVESSDTVRCIEKSLQSSENIFLGSSRIFQVAPDQTIIANVSSSNYWDEDLNNYVGPRSNGDLYFIEANETRSGFLQGNDWMPIVPLRGEYLLIFGAMPNDPPRENSSQENSSEDVFVFLFHIPSSSLFHRVSFECRNVPAIHCCSTSDGNAVAISVDGTGLIVAGNGLTTLQCEHSEPRTKRARGVRTKKKKDCFARGMRQTMG